MDEELVSKGDTKKKLAMRDFTLKAYIQYIDILKTNYNTVIRFDHYLEDPDQYKLFCLIRHDVDRKPLKALKMAKLEYEKGIKSSYYFRMKRFVFKKRIIKKIESFGHEIGYHYEELCDERGNEKKALELFRKNLAKFNELVQIKTICMHGRPFCPYDNRRLWIKRENKEILKKELMILGELYLDINYENIAYINDTGRNWLSQKSNIRDTVASNINTDFISMHELSKFLKIGKNSIVFQIHPERWSSNLIDWLFQFFKDFVINIIKAVVKKNENIVE